MAHRFCDCLSLFLLLIPATAAAAEPKVGSLENCDRIEFAGNHSVPTDDLRRELGKDLEVLVAGRAEADRITWLKTLESRIQFGYQVSGYAEARATAHVDEVRSVVVIEIQEGPQYHCGEIEIVGVKSLPVDQFRQLMSQERLDRAQSRMAKPIPPDLPPKDSDLLHPIWMKGKKAECAEHYWNTRRRHSFQLIFQSLGYFDPKFAIRIRLEPDKTATLIVQIAEEGPRSTLDGYKITGLARNKPGDLINYLDLPVGTPLTLDVKRQIERKLWESARFSNYHVELVTAPPGGATPRSTVEITATELDEVPLLSTPLTGEQQAFLRLFKRLAAIDQTGDDLQVTMSNSSDGSGKVADEGAIGFGADGSVTLADTARAAGDEEKSIGKLLLIISPAAKSLFLSSEETDKNGKTLLGYSILFTPNRLIIDSIPNRTRYEFNDFHAKVLFQVNWDHDEAEERPNRLMFGAGYGTTHPGSVPFQLQAVIPPALALQLFETQVKNLELNDQVASIDLPDRVRISFDNRTGAVHDFTMSDEADAFAFKSGPNIFSEFLAKHEASMAGAQVIDARGQPATALARFLRESTKDSSSPRLARLSQFGQRMLDRHSFRGLDALLNQMESELDQDGFSIPYDAPSPLVRQNAWWPLLVSRVSASALPQKEVIRVVSHEVALSQAMRNYHESSAMAEAFALGKTGPVTDLLASWAFRQLGSDTPEVISSKKQEISRATFHHDCDLFLNDDWAVGQLILGFVGAIQASDEAEINELIALAIELDENLAMLKPLLLWLHQQRDNSPREALMALLDSFWDAAIRPALISMTEGPRLEKPPAASHPKAQSPPKPLIKPAVPMQRPAVQRRMSRRRSRN